MDWCAFTAPFHLYNVFRRCSLLSVALSIASPLLGVTQHPALRSPDFPHPDCKITFGTRPSTQLKPFYYTPSGNLKATKSEFQPFRGQFPNGTFQNIGCFGGYTLSRWRKRCIKKVFRVGFLSSPSLAHFSPSP